MRETDILRGLSKAKMKCSTGTPFVSGPKGVDKVDAKLTRGEAVLPVKTVQALERAGINLARLIQDTNDGKTPKRGLRDGGKYVDGAAPLVQPVEPPKQTWRQWAGAKIAGTPAPASTPVTPTAPKTSGFGRFNPDVTWKGAGEIAKKAGSGLKSAVGPAARFAAGAQMGVTALDALRDPEGAQQRWSKRFGGALDQETDDWDVTRALKTAAQTGLGYAGDLAHSMLPDALLPQNLVDTAPGSQAVTSAATQTPDTIKEMFAQGQENLNSPVLKAAADMKQLGRGATEIVFGHGGVPLTKEQVGTGLREYPDTRFAYDLGMPKGEQTARMYKSADKAGNVTYEGVGTGEPSAAQQARDADFTQRGWGKDIYGNWTPPGGWAAQIPADTASETTSSRLDPQADYGEMTFGQIGAHRRGLQAQELRDAADADLHKTQLRERGEWGREMYRQDAETERERLKQRGAQAGAASKERREEEASIRANAEARDKFLDSLIPRKIRDAEGKEFDNPERIDFNRNAAHTIASQAAKNKGDPAWSRAGKPLQLGDLGEAAVEHLTKLQANKERLKKSTQRFGGGWYAGNKFMDSDDLTNYDFSKWETVGDMLVSPDGGMKIRIEDLQDEEPAGVFVGGGGARTTRYGVRGG